MSDIQGTFQNQAPSIRGSIDGFLASIANTVVDVVDHTANTLAKKNRREYLHKSLRPALRAD